MAHVRNVCLISLGIHYRRTLAVRLKYRTMHKQFKRNLSSALPDFNRFENVLIMTIDSFVCKLKKHTPFALFRFYTDETKPDDYIPLSMFRIFTNKCERNSDHP